MSKEIDYLKVSHAYDLKEKKERIIFRFFEIIPGFFAWSTLILLIALSFTAPYFIAIFIIIFDIYWMIRIAYFYYHLSYAFKTMKWVLKIDWFEKLKNLSKERGNLEIKWEEIYHLVILPFYKEDLFLIRQTFDALSNSNYPIKEKMIVVLAGEERVLDHARNVAEEIEKEFGDKFFRFLATFHPKDILGELAGKGANATWAARKAKEIIDELGIAYENIIVSNFDIDTVVPKNYFARLTYVFLTTEDRLHASYQPVPLYLNNIWFASPLSKIAAFSTTFWGLLNQERPEKLKTFSSHSMPFKALVDVDFWKTDVVTEDNIIFFQCFLKYNGNYRVIPLYFPVSMDANMGKNSFQTIINIYRQHRRWGWGVETIPYMLYGFLKNKSISLKKKISQAFDYIESFWSWSTNSIIIALFGWLPNLVGGEKFKISVLSLNLSDVTGTILRITMFALIFSAFFSISLLPSKPIFFGKLKYFLFAIQWLLTPILMIFFITLPGLEAQTRLMFKKYMGFWVTPKERRVIQSELSC